MIVMTRPAMMTGATDGMAFPARAAENPPNDKMEKVLVFILIGWPVLIWFENPDSP